MSYRTVSQPRTDVQTTNLFLRGVYNWMSLGLGLTALVAYTVATTPAIAQFIFSNTILFWGLIIASSGLFWPFPAQCTACRQVPPPAFFCSTAP